MKGFGGLALAAAMMLASSAFGQEEKTELKVGDEAPDFKLQGSDGKEYTLGQFKGEKPVLLAFFPKAFTGG